MLLYKLLLIVYQNLLSIYFIVQFYLWKYQYLLQYHISYFISLTLYQSYYTILYFYRAENIQRAYQQYFKALYKSPSESSVGGNLLRCALEIGKVIKDGVSMAIQLKAGNYAVLANLREIIGKLTPVMTECSNPICLADAKKRCEASTGKECEQWGLIMYPKCPEGTQPFGCCLCVPKCPEGFRNDGLFCAKPAPYGRGAGYPWKFGDGLNLDGARRRCSASNQQGCEQWGAIIYPKCKESFHNVACCVCSPNCPAGMTDIGVSCLKKIHGRGVGYAMKFSDCSNNTDNQPINDNTNLTDQQLNNQIIDTTNQLQQNESNIARALPYMTKLAGLYAQLDSRLSKKQ